MRRIVQRWWGLGAWIVVCYLYGRGLYFDSSAGIQWPLFLVMGGVIVLLEWIGLTSLKRRIPVTNELKAEMQYRRVRMRIEVMVFGSLFLVALMVALVR